VALSVCLLLDGPAERAVRRLWQRLEEAGVRTLLTHTHGRHVPHLTLASLTSYDVGAVLAATQDAVRAGPAGTSPLRFDGLGLFPRSRAWLAPVVTTALLEHQRAVTGAVLRTGAELHPHYRPGAWLPHLTLAPRLTLDRLATLAGTVNEVLPLATGPTRTGLVDTRTGEVRELG
jgi:2'-5' RNA ligase